MFLRIISLSKSFGALMAVSDVNLDVETGERLAVIGPNGAGKSTFFQFAYRLPFARFRRGAV